MISDFLKNILEEVIYYMKYEINLFLLRSSDNSLNRYQIFITKLMIRCD